MSEDLKLARDINTPAEKLRELASKIIEECKEDLASPLFAEIVKNPNTPPDLLIELSRKYLKEIGTNPALDLILFEYPNFIEDIWYERLDRSCCGYDLDRFDFDMFPDWFLKLLPAKILQDLATSKDKDVREFVVYHQNTPIDLLEKLATDDSEWVRYGVASNKNIPISLLEKLATDENAIMVKCGVAGNKNTPIYILEKLATDECYIVRGAVADNKNTPIYILKKFTNDENDAVRKLAKETLSLKAE